MAQLDVKVKFSGGAAPLKTLSNKQVVSVNKYLMTEDFNDDQDTLALFRWARNSTEAKQATQMEEEFLQKVKATKAMSQKSKEMVKQKRQSRALDLLSKCRSHGGPLSRDNMQLLESLTYDELVCEVSYLKATIAKDLRLKHKVNTGVGNKYRFEKLARENLQIGIRNVLQQSKGPIKPVEELLSKMFGYIDMTFQLWYITNIFVHVNNCKHIWLIWIFISLINLKPLFCLKCLILMFLGIEFYT